jgi:6-phosphogluconolactonase
MAHSRTSPAPTAADGTCPPGPSRRRLLETAAAMAAAPLLANLPAESASASTAASPSPSRELIYVGAWQGTQLYAAWFDSVRGSLDAIGPVADITSNWTTKHPTRPVLYVAGNDLAGSVTPYTVDETTGTLTSLGAAVATAPSNTASGGLGLITVDAPSNTLLVANYASGQSASIPIARDGSLGRVASVIQDTGSGPNSRQAGPHAHDAVVSPDGRYVLVPDFGADRVYIRRFDRAAHKLEADGVPGPGFYAAAAGSGPRRIVFHPDGRTAYVVNELTADIQTLAWDPKQATLTLRQDLSTDSPAFTGTKSAAELAISRDGRFVYVSNRGENTLLVYATDPRTGLLALIQRTDPGGTSPWSFSLHPSGRWLLVANLVSDTVNLFSVDEAGGKLADTGASVSIPSPDCITFERLHRGQGE